MANLRPLLRSLPRAPASRGVLRPPAPRVLAPSSSYATHAPTPPTQISTLSNGLTVATEALPSPSTTATVGVWIDAGSRSETPSNNGVAHFLEHMAFKGTGKRSQGQLEVEVEDRGAHLNAYTSREQTVYYARCFEGEVPWAVELISDILQNSKLDPSAIERERDVILREMAEVDKQKEEVVFDHLHASAFQDQPLGQTILGPVSNIRSLSRPDLQNYIKTNYTADRMVLVGVGSTVDHAQLVALAEKHFSSLPTSPNPLPLGSTRGSSPARKATEFVGSEVRMRDDTSPTANIALAVKGVGWSHPDHFPLLVLQSVFGNWDRSLGSAGLLSSKLSHTVAHNGLANSFMSFSTSYSDVGLWGIYLVTEAHTAIDDLIHFVVKDWRRLATSATEAEVERAKAQLRAGLLLGLDGTNAVAEDVGRQMVTGGRRMGAAEVEAKVAGVSTEDVMRVAKEYIWDKDLAIAAHGRIEGMLDYNRIRNEMSSLRW